MSMCYFKEEPSEFDLVAFQKMHYQFWLNANITFTIGQLLFLD